MRRLAARVSIFLLSGCLAAPGAPAPAQPAPAQVGAPPPAGADAQKPAWQRSCEEYAGAPVALEYQDGSGGAAVLYRTRGSVQGLRQRIAQVAAFHNGAGHKAPDMHDLYHIPHRAYVEDIEGGAKLVLVPKSMAPRLLDELRRNVQQEVTRMQKHGCQHSQEAL